MRIYNFDGVYRATTEKDQGGHVYSDRSVTGFCCSSLGGHSTPGGAAAHAARLALEEFFRVVGTEERRREALLARVTKEIESA